MEVVLNSSLKTKILDGHTEDDPCKFGGCTVSLCCRVVLGHLVCMVLEMSRVWKAIDNKQKVCVVGLRTQPQTNATTIHHILTTKITTQGINIYSYYCNWEKQIIRILNCFYMSHTANCILIVVSYSCQVVYQIGY